MHSSTHSVMSQYFRSSSSNSSIFHRHVARAFAPEFPISFKLKLSFVICTESWKSEVTCALKIEVINKVDWLVIQFALFNFLNIFISSNKHTQHPGPNLDEENFEKQRFVVSLQKNLFLFGDCKVEWNYSIVRTEFEIDFRIWLLNTTSI